MDCPFTKAIKRKSKTTSPAAAPVLPRQDRHDTYVGVLIALWCAGWGILFAPLGQGAIAYYQPDTQKLLAILLVIGTSIALTGSASGIRPLPITMPARLVKSIFCRLLRIPSHGPMEVRYCYLLGCAGLIAVDMGLLFFSFAILANSSVIGTATGILTPILTVVFFKKLFRFWRLYRKLTHDFNLVKKAVSEVRETGENGDVR